TEEEIKKRNGQIAEQYGVVKGLSKEEGEAQLRQDFKSQFSGPEQDLALALHDNDPVAADIARIEVERSSTFYASDDTLKGILKSQGERARREGDRDRAAAELKLHERIAIAELRGFPLSEEEIKSARDRINADVEKKVKENAAKYMSALEKGYDEKHGKYGKGSLQIVIALNMSGDERDMARDLIKGGGLLKPEQELDYAIRDDDPDAIKGMFAGKKESEVKDLIAAWEKAHSPRKFAAYVESEFDGRDLFDIKQRLKGEPQTPQEQLDRAKEELEFEQSAYGAADYFSKDERKYMEGRLEALRANVERVNKLKAEGKENTPEYERAFRGYKKQTSRFELSVKDHRQKIDSVTDTAATIAAVIATVVAIVVISVLTAGAGTAVLAAVMAGMSSASVAAGSAVAATLATFAVKQGFKGKAYSKKELTTDLTVGAVEAVASALTAGLGGKLLSAGRLAKLSQSGKMLPRLFANAMAEGAEGFASSLPGALTGALTNKQNWKGDPFANIMGSTLAGVGMGTILSGGMGMLGGISKPAAKGAGKAVGEAADAAEALAEQARKHPPLETPDVLARRGTPAERLAGWKSFKEANPGKPYDDFIAQLDAGVVTHKADEEAVRQARRELREELFTDIPPAQREQFKDVVVDVLSDAEFDRLTRSAKGQAVVLIENGKPRVLLRESADPKALREEGIHLLQSVDPKTSHLFQRLDEGVVSKWDELPLGEQLSLYRTKLDLEIDGQQRLIRNLDDALLAAGDDAATRKQLLNQIEEAKETLDNLSHRLDEVAEITPQKQLAISKGKAPRPEYLDQPARLFAKKGRLTVKRELVASLKAMGIDTKEAKRVLERLRVASLKRGQKGPFDAVADKLAQLAKSKSPNAKAYAETYIDELGKTFDNWVGEPKGVLGIIEASTKMKNPAGFLGAATRVAGAGLDATER
ncbi:MAG TPA: hypothetical protein VGA87_11670, partial [Pyrinomonadaceae bacterium]